METGRRRPGLWSTLLAGLWACSDPGESGGPKDRPEESAADSSPETGVEVDSDSGIETSTSDSETDSGGGDSDTQPDTTAEVEPLDPVDLHLPDVADAKLIGEDAWDAGVGAEIAVAGAGDVNADGLADVVVGLEYAVGGGTGHDGAAFLLFGPVSGAVGLALADASLYGAESENAGYAVAGAGDVNADGFDDILVGAPFRESGDEVDRAYLVSGPVESVRPLADSAAILTGGDDATGVSVDGAGDTDGDGFDDVLLLAYGSGAAYLLRGPLEGALDLNTHAALLLYNDASEAVRGVGDTDGDGLDDVLIGVEIFDDNTIAGLFLGGVSGEVTIGDADADFVDLSSDTTGANPAGLGDADGDGYPDLAFDSGADDEGGDYAGAAYVSSGPFSGSVDVPAVSAKIVGEAWARFSAYTLDGAGDVDGDGLGDLVAGACLEGGDEYDIDGPGVAYVCHAPFLGTRMSHECEERLTGEGSQLVGKAVAGAGDTDGDGLADVLIGAPGDDEGGTEAGAAFLLLGSTLITR